jgi:hypothetical protein
MRNNLKIQHKKFNADFRKTEYIFIFCIVDIILYVLKKEGMEKINK